MQDFFHLCLCVKKSGHPLPWLNTGSICASKCCNSQSASLLRNDIAGYLMHWMKPYGKAGSQIRILVIHKLKSIEPYIIFLSSHKMLQQILHINAIICTSSFWRLVLMTTKSLKVNSYSYLHIFGMQEHINTNYWSQMAQDHSWSPRENDKES